MRKAIWWFSAFIGMCLGALLGFVVFVEWLAFSERNAQKISVALALVGAALAFELASKLLPEKTEPKS